MIIVTTKKVALMKLIDQEKDMNILAKREMNLEVNLGKL